MHHSMSLSSVSEAAINRTPARLQRGTDEISRKMDSGCTNELNVTTGGTRWTNGRDFFYLCCVVLYEPLQASAGWKMQKTLVADGRESKPAGLAELPRTSGGEGQKVWC